MKPTDLDIKQMLREYVSMELVREAHRENSPLAVRVLGEVLANKPGFNEAVHVAVADVVRELSMPALYEPKVVRKLQATPSLANFDIARMVDEIVNLKGEDVNVRRVAIAESYIEAFIETFVNYAQRRS